jgi:predicted transposase YbfD/YdcC
MVSAYASEARLILAQAKVSDKSNEITAIPELLDCLDIREATITIDAAGCQFKIADQIVQFVLMLFQQKKRCLLFVLTGASKIVFTGYWTCRSARTNLEVEAFI